MFTHQYVQPLFITSVPFFTIICTMIFLNLSGLFLGGGEFFSFACPSDFSDHSIGLPFFIRSLFYRFAYGKK